MLASLGLRHKSGECARSRVRKYHRVSAVRAAETPTFVT